MYDGIKMLLVQPHKLGYRNSLKLLLAFTISYYKGIRKNNPKRNKESSHV